ncbi:MAG TPA: hypothetical protein VL688_06670 [Verrucomicrobiae bacterium]|nr:hypothetical protein [Verrucomicrobiae bacterium]
MGQEYCEFGSMTFGKWLRCSACLHTKAGLLLVAAGNLLLWKGIPGLPDPVLWGKGLLAAGILLLVYSLAKDLLVIARRRKRA